MKKYLAVMSAAFKRTLEYRLNMLVVNLQSVFTLFILFYFWKAVFSYKSILGGYTFEEMVTFYFLIRVTQNRTSPFEANSFANDIKSGAITSSLLKPVNLIWYRVFFKAVVGNMWSVGNLVAILFFSQFLYSALVLPKNIVTFLIYIVVLLLNGILSLLINIIIGSLGFWITEVTHLKTITYQVVSILSGALIPLTFFPDSFRKVTNILPFKYLVQFPVDIYLGKLTNSELITNFILMSLWLIVLSIFSQVLFKRGLRTYESFN